MKQSADGRAFFAGFADFSERRIRRETNAARKFHRILKMKMEPQSVPAAGACVLLKKAFLQKTGRRPMALLPQKNPDFFEKEGSLREKPNLRLIDF